MLKKVKKEIKLEELINFCFLIDDYWLDCEDPENERRAEVRSVTQKTYACTCRHLTVSMTYIEDITCQRVDMNFIFEWSTRYLTSEHSE